MSHLRFIYVRNERSYLFTASKPNDIEAVRVRCRSIPILVITVSTRFFSERHRGVDCRFHILERSEAIRSMLMDGSMSSKTLTARYYSLPFGSPNRISIPEYATFSSGWGLYL
jgi:hypothetical protein